MGGSSANVVAFMELFSWRCQTYISGYDPLVKEKGVKR